MLKKYSFPEKYQEKIESALNAIGFSLDKPGALSDAVMELSGFYQQKEKTTPWIKKSTQAAYWAYFFPLNYIRNLKVFDELVELDFPHPHRHFLDFGFGLGSGFLAAKDSGFLPPGFQTTAVDSSSVPLKLFEGFLMETDDDIRFSSRVQNAEDFDSAVFSYSLNENSPQWLSQIPNLILIEPSTQWAGRNLMELRSKLQAEGLQMWAPCTHQNSCPLLGHSKTDWCHDRVHWTPPEWWKKLEALLPIKNQTLTYSYLAASRKPAVISPEGRVVGDELKEKGKSRWLYCRGEEREFLSWLNKSGEPPEIHRGERLHVDVVEKKGNELRFKLL